MKKYWIVASLALTGCQMRPLNQTAMTDLSCQVADAAQAQHVTQTELDILHEKINRQLTAQDKTDTELKKLSTEMAMSQKKLAQAEQEINALEERVIARVDELQSALGSVADLKKYDENYTVKPGDTLEKIAKSQKTTISALKKANDLKGDTIYPGQKLSIQ